MPIVPNLEGLLPMPLLPPEELEKERQELCLYLSISKEEGVCGLPRSAFSPGLNRPTLKIEKRRGAVNMHQGRRGILHRK
jgi:hypothetical protein